MRRRTGVFRWSVILSLFLLILIWSAPVAGSSHGFTITAPTASSVWYPGATVNITWTGGSTSTLVNLRLVDVNAWTVVASIASAIPNSGSYTWTVPSNIPAGRPYLVYIENVERTVWAYGQGFPLEKPDGKPDLAIAKKPDGPLQAGQQGDYVLIVTNVGSGPAYGPIVVTDNLGSGLTFVSASGSGWTCTGSGSTVTCTHPGPVPAATALAPITITVAVADDAKEVKNCATVRAEEEQEGNLENNRTCVGTPVQPPRTGTVCGIKFDDRNGNGVQDPGEPGLAGWTIVLLDADGSLVASAVTGTDGTYCFRNLPMGSYTVSEMSQAGWTQTYPATPGTHQVTLTAEKPGVDGLAFGNQADPKPGVICGVKFHDKNGNGTQDPGEPGLPGWTIQMTDAAGNVVASVTTGAGGRFCFKDVKPGTYIFSEVKKPNWVQTTPAAPGTYTVTVQSGQNQAPLIFGNKKGKEPCCLTFRFPGGRRDRFATADGLEAATPSPALADSLPTSPLAVFDGQTMDRFFAHTFTLPQGNCIRRARLEIMARPLAGTSLSSNDTVRLRFTGVTGSGSWGSHFGSGNPNPGLLPNQWVVSNYGAGQLFTLDLGNLPDGSSLLSDLNTHRFLDVVIQDDTSVDFMVLTVEFCECDQTDGDGPVGPPDPTTKKGKK